MITKSNICEILLSKPFGFVEKEVGFYTRHYGSEDGGFDLSYNASAGTFDYPDGVIADRNTTVDTHQKESFVVFLCVAQLFERGYQPNHLKLEGINYQGTDKGYCDILVSDNNKEEYLIIECKTADVGKKEDEFRKHWAKTLRNGDQLFRYFNTYRKAKYLCLFAADYPEYTKEGKTEHRYENIYHIISLLDNEEYLKTDCSLQSFKSLRENQGSSEDFFNVWKKTYTQDYNTRGLLESGIEAFNIGKKSYSVEDLGTVDEYALEKKYNEFALILRKHTVSSHENAFDKLVNLFLSKIIDEKYNFKELTLLWKGAAYDDYFSLQDRLNLLYRQGMKEFFEDEVTYVENQEIDNAFRFLTSKADAAKDTIKKYFRELKYFSNNPFAFLDVHNKDLFFQNAVILKDVISMLQDIYLTKHTDNQFLGDLFEGFLNKGVHQSEGQFFTPLPIVRFLVSSLPLQYLVENSEGIPRVIDYACGAGHFLTEYAKQIKPFVESKEADAFEYYKQVIGIEKDYRLSKVSQVAAFMYGMDGIHIHFGDGLSEIPGVKNGSFDVLIANPPYSVSGFLETLTEEQRTHYSLTPYVNNIEKNKAIETFFIERSAQLLKSDGVAAIILPNSILTQDNLYMRVRELLLKKFDIIAICEFGKNTFGQTNTSTVTLFLRRKSSNPDVSKHLQHRVDEWFQGNMSDDPYYDDAELLNAYIEQISISREDYLCMMKGQLTDAFLQSERGQEYVEELNIYKASKNKTTKGLADEAKAIRAEGQGFVTGRIFKQFTSPQKEEIISQYTLRFIQAIEKEKLYFYLLMASNPNPVLIIKSPEKKEEEKNFLGYEWSQRNGNEGIKYLNVKKQTSADDEEDDDTLSQLKGIYGIDTPLFHPINLDDEEKINVLIRKNFLGETVCIPSDLSKYVMQTTLVDMIDFSSVSFNKGIKTSGIKKIVIASKCPLVKLGKICEINKYSINPLDTPQKEFTYIDIDAVENATGYYSTDKKIIGALAPSRARRIVKSDSVVISTVRPNLRGFIYIGQELENTIFSTGFAVLQSVDKEKLINKYLYQLFMYSEDLMGQMLMAMPKGLYPSINKADIESFRIPLPLMDIQKKIVDECEKVDEEYAASKDLIENAERKLFDSLEYYDSSVVRKLSDICSMRAGKFVKASDIHSVQDSQYQYPCYGGNGLRGYTKTMTDEGTYTLIGRQGALCGNICVASGQFHATEHAVVVYPNENINSLWLRYVLEQMNLNQYATGRAQPGLSVQNILKLKIDVPSFEEQQRIAAEIVDYENQISTARSVMNDCAARKALILDKYLK